MPEPTHDFLGPDPVDYVAEQARADGTSLAGWIAARVAMSEQAAADDEPHRED